MSSLSLPKLYETGDVLFESDLDAIKEAAETFFNETGISDDNLQDRGLNGTTKVIDGTVTTATLEDSSISTTAIADSAVTTDKIADENIIAGMIPSAAVTRTKMVELNQEISADFDVTVPGLTTSTLESVTITTSGRPVIVAFVPDSNGETEWFSSYVSDTSDINSTIRIKRDSTTIGTFPLWWYFNNINPATDQWEFLFNVEIPPTCAWVLDTPAAGTYTYTITGQAGEDTDWNASQTSVFKGRLLAYEVQ